MEYYIISPLLFGLRIVEFFSQFIFALTILNVKINFKKVFVASILFSVLFEIVKIIIPQYLTGVVATFFDVITIMCIFKINYKKAIISCIVTGIAVAIVDCLVSLFIVWFCKLTTFSEISQSEPLMIIGRMVISVIICLIALIIKTIISKKESFNKIENIKSSISLVTILITFALLIPNLVMILYYHDNKDLPLTIIIINIIAIIAMFFINIYNTQRGIKLIQAEEELITEKTYNKTLQNLVDGLRAFKHDYNNTLQTMYGYILTDNMPKLNSFFTQILDESRAITALDKLNPELFRSPGLLGLVTAKFEYARKSNVTMNFEIYADLDNIDMKMYDFTRMLGIFLDNAIEASAGSDKKVVDFCVMERNGKVTIDISNSFADDKLKIEDISKKGVSSKGENRGLGLYKVEQILEKYPLVYHEVTSTNGMFLQKLVIDKVKQPVV